MSRPLTAGPNAGPEPPFPIQLSGKIIKGFGRGSKELGIPTANIPITGLDIGGHTDINSGIYYGFAGLSTAGGTTDVDASDKPDAGVPREAVNDSDINVFPMVMSIGWNPYYKNKVRSVEVHIIHKFHSDFYGALLNLSILGFIRDEKDYESMELLIEDINTDIAVAGRSLERAAYASLAKDKYLTTFEWAIAESN